MFCFCGMMRDFFVCQKKIVHLQAGNYKSIIMKKLNFKILAFSLLFFLNCSLVYSLDCFPGRTFEEIRKIEYENSDVIFLGVPVYFYGNGNSGFARFKVSEVLKGVVDSIVYVEFEMYCPYDETHRSGIFRLWLIYGNKCDYDYYGYNVIITDLCTISRYMGRFWFFPPPYPDGIDNHFLHSTILRTSARNHADLLFFEEIEVLRTIRDVRNLQKAEANSEEARIKKTFDDHIIWILFAMFFLNLILLAVIAFKIYTLKTTTK